MKADLDAIDWKILRELQADGRMTNVELASKIFVSLSPKGPAERRSFANCRAYGITKFSKNQDAAKAYLEALTDNYREGAKASTGYNMPMLKGFAKPPLPIISEDPKLKPLEQDAEYHFTIGYPGSFSPAADEVYQQFIMVDALAQYCTDKLDLEACVAFGEALWCFGSGSLRRREHIVRMTMQGDAVADVELVDAHALYEALREALAVTELNVEGAAIVGAMLRVFHRGNGLRGGGSASVPGSGTNASWPV